MSNDNDNRIVGIVIRIEGPEFVVAEASTSADAPRHQCVLAGKRILRGRPVVGDRVDVDLPAQGDSYAVICGVHPRETLIERANPGGRRGSRAIVANVDRLVIVAAIHNPPFRAGLVDRMIVAAEALGILPVVCLNKADLAQPGDLACLAPYRELGYPVAVTSAETSRGLDDLLAELRGHQSAFVGHSGVGKTSLMERIFAGQGHDFRVAAVSERTGRGRHTTTHAQLLPLAAPHGPGFVVDTPGIREFGLVDVEPEALAGYFVDFSEHAASCRFSPCTHTHEPGCGVKAAVDEGAITSVRYESYERLHAELVAEAAERSW